MSTGLILDAGTADASTAEASTTPDASTSGGYGRCEREVACGGGTTCVAAVVSGDGMLASHCSAPCTRAEDCPASAGGAPAATCVRSGETGQCYAGCTGNSDCAGGMVCAPVPDSTLRLCVPLGGITSTSRLAPYQRCASGDLCADSACETASIRVGDAPVGSFCAVRCATDAAACPGYDPRASAPTVRCVAVGSAPPQCHRACVAQSDCDRDGTTCVEVRTGAGEAVRVCAPRG